MSQSTSSYTTAAADGGVKFRVVPAVSPSAGLSILRGLLCAIPAWFIINIAMIPVFLVLGQENWFSIAVVGAGFFIIWYKLSGIFKRWILKKENAVRHAYDTEIMVDASGLSVASKKLTLTRANMHRLVIKNAYDHQVEMPMSHVAVAGSALTVGSVAAANAVTNGIAMSFNNKIKALSRVSYQVTVEAGGVSHVVAGGLTDVCAYGLMTDIDRALNGTLA